MYSVVFGWYVLYIFVPSCLICHLWPVFPYCFFGLDDLSIDVSGVLKSPVITLLYVSSFRSLNICLIYLGAPGVEIHEDC